MMVFRTVLGQAMEALAPMARNSNLLPVNAKGLVRFLSLEWRGICGSVWAPRSSRPPCLVEVASPRSS